MKKLFLALMALTITISVSAKVSPAFSFNELPTESQNFISSNFGTASIKQIKEGPLKYKVELINGTEIQFYKDGSFKQAEAPKYRSLPIGILNALPANVKSYVTSKYGSWNLTDVEVKTSGKIEVELEKGKYEVELEFNQSGRLLKEDIDD